MFTVLKFFDFKIEIKSGRLIFMGLLYKFGKLPNIFLT